MGSKAAAATFCFLCALQIGLARYVRPRYVPHYDLLDPLTGRSIRNPRTNAGANADARLFGVGAYADAGADADRRPQREIQQHRFLLPMGAHKSYSSFRQSRQLNGDLLFDDSAANKDPEGTPAFRSSSSFRPRRRRPDLSRFRKPTFFGLLDPVKEEEEEDEDQSYNYASANALYNQQLSYNTGDDDSPNEVPTSAGFLTTDKNVLVTGDNSFNGVQLAYKWRKRYPYYGGRRKRRSAQRFRLPSPPLRRQSTWVLLDPLTGRIKNSPFASAETSGSESAAETRENHDFIDADDVRERDRFVRNGDGDRRFFFNDSERPVYKYYKRYPYTG